MKLLREPLLHFLILSAGLFGLSGLFSDESGYAADASNEIVVSAGQIQALAANFEKNQRRSASPSELDALIQSFIREEVLYREALAMGLDRGDAMIKRLLSQKLAFVVTDIAQLDAPDDEQLARYLKENSEAYREPTRISFRHVYLSEERGDEAAGLLEQLVADQVDFAALEHSPLIPRRFEKAAVHDIQRVLGGEFVANLAGLPEGRWQGPVKSGLGYHLVFLTERIEGEVPGLDAVRPEVQRDWLSRRQKELNEAYYQSLLARYAIKIQQPSSGDQAGVGSASLSLRNPQS